MNSFVNKIKFLNIFGILALCLVVSCKSDPSISKKNTAKEEAPVQLTTADRIKALANNPEAVHRIFQTAEFKLIVDYTKEKESQWSMRTEGLEPEVNQYDVFPGTIFNVFLMDLDGNSFNEFVFRIDKNDGSENSELLAFVSDEGKALELINIKRLPVKMDPGMDVIDFNRNRIVRTFRSNGQVVEYTYSLAKEGDKYVMRPSKTK